MDNEKNNCNIGKVILSDSLENFTCPLCQEKTILIDIGNRVIAYCSKHTYIHEKKDQF